MFCLFTMGIFNFFSNKNKHKFSDEEREMSATTRGYTKELKRMEFEIKKQELDIVKLQKEAQILELKAEIYGDDEDEDGFSPEEMLINILTKGQGLQALFNQNTTSFTPPTTETKGNLTDEQIDDILSNVNPVVLLQVKKLSNEQISDYIKKNYPSYDDETISRVILKVKAV